MRSLACSKGDVGLLLNPGPQRIDGVQSIFRIFVQFLLGFLCRPLIQLTHVLVLSSRHQIVTLHHVTLPTQTQTPKTKAIAPLGASRQMGDNFHSRMIFNFYRATERGGGTIAVNRNHYRNLLPILLRTDQCCVSVG